jgi:predicted lipoprotein with Yx(FWY)xxD motif
MIARPRMLPAAAALLTATLALSPIAGLAQNSGSKASDQSSASSKDRWLHVRVQSQSSHDETVRVNVPLEFAVKVLPTIDRDRLHNGKVKLDDVDCHGIDLPALLAAVRTAKDGEFVTVQSNDNDVRVAKEGLYFFVHVVDKKQGTRKSQVEVKVPMKVIDALFSSGSDQLDLVAGLHALSAQGDTELVSVKDQENTVRVWLDSKNISD